MDRFASPLVSTHAWDWSTVFLVAAVTMISTAQPLTSVRWNSVLLVTLGFKAQWNGKCP